MNQLKTFSAALLAVMAMWALTGTASATTPTSPAGTTYTSTVSATSTSLSFHGSFWTVSCAHSQLAMKIESHGGSVTASGKVSSWTFTECNWPMTVLKAGTLEFHATGGGNGTLTSTGTELLMHTSVGECVLTTNGTDIGTFTGGTPAKLDINSSAIPRTGGSFFCGSNMQWTGSYTFTTPGNLSLD
jgi:hypothetical protein